MKTLDGIDRLLAWCVTRGIAFNKFEVMVNVYMSDKAYYDENGFESLERAI